MRASRTLLTLLACATAFSACQNQPFSSPLSRASAPLQQNSVSSFLQHTLLNQYQAQFQEHDLNHNGRLEPQELPHAPQTFSRLDRNRDGFLSPEEAQPESSFLRRQGEFLLKELRTAFESKHSGSEDPQLEMPLENSYAQFENAFLSQTETFRSSMEQNNTPQTTGRTPVLLVPGYAEPSWYFMYGIYRDLKKAGWPVEGINLFPNFASAEEQAAKVKAKAEALMKKYGSKKVNLVVHSFGGLISRYFIQERGGNQAVENLVTVATPHLGTYTAYLGPGQSAVQLRPESEFIQKLNAQGFTRPPVKYTSIWPNPDEIVIPPKNSIMPDSEVQYVPWTGHLTIMFSKRTYAHIRQALEKPTRR